MFSGCKLKSWGIHGPCGLPCVRSCLPMTENKSGIPCTSKFQIRPEGRGVEALNSSDTEMRSLVPTLRYLILQNIKGIFYICSFFACALPAPIYESDRVRNRQGDEGRRALSESCAFITKRLCAEIIVVSQNFVVFTSYLIVSRPSTDGVEREPMCISTVRRRVVRRSVMKKLLGIRFYIELV